MADPLPSTQLSPRKAQNLLYLINLLLGMGITLVFAVMPMLGRELALDQLQFNVPFTDIVLEPKELAITIFSAMSTLVYTITAPLWGRYSDKHGRKKAILLGLFGYAAGTLFFCWVIDIGLSGSVTGMALYSLLVVSRGLAVLVNSATQPAAGAFIVDTAPLAERAKCMARLAAANQLGIMLGPMIAYLTIYGFIAPFAVHAGIIFLGAILLWIALPDSAPKPMPEGISSKSLSPFDPRFSKLLLIFVLSFTLLGTCQQTLAFYIQDTFGLSTKEAAKLYSLAVGAAAIATLFAQLVLVPKLGGSPFRLIFYGLPLAMVGAFMIAFSKTPTVLFIGNALMGGGLGLVGPGLSVSATFMVEDYEQGQISGLISSAGALGFVIGPLLGGYVYRFDHSAPFLIAGVLFIPVFFYCRNLYSKRHGKNRSAQ